VDAELLYQRGLPPHATYLFKHALIQDTAYQSLLKSRRQQVHRQIAQVLEEKFSETKETQPELLAHHYTEANLIEQAIPYWQQAGEHAVTQSANEEAISHLTKAIVLLKRFPETLERAQHELTLHIALGPPLMVTRGFAAPELATIYDRARVLCQQLGETPQLAPTLYGLAVFYYGRAQLPTARTLSEQILTLAQNTNTPILLLMGRFLVAATLLKQGEFVAAQEHAVQGIALYDDYRRQPGTVQAHHYGVGCLNSLAHVLWLMGYPDQARRRSQEALPLAQDMGRPFTLAQALSSTTWLSHHLHEPQAAETYAHALTTLCTDQGFPLWQAEGAIIRGWVLAEQGREEEGVVQICQGVTNYQATGAELILPDSLAVLAAAYGKMGRTEEGLAVVVDALARVDTTDGREWEAELYRLRGELTLQQASQKSNGKSQKSKMTDPQPPTPDPQGEAEACFLKAIEIAQKQQAKS
jgi:predicted ATPase